MNLQNLDFTPLWITMKTGVAGGCYGLRCMAVTAADE